MNRMDNKVALITGSASGIGEAVARLLAKEGAKTVITTRRKVKEGQALAEEIQAAGGEATFLKLDVSQEDDWQRVITGVLKKYGKLNVVVNNAGISLVKNIEETSAVDWHTIMDTNSTGVFLGTKYAINAMKDNGEPCSIVNISSIEADINEPLYFAYSAAKAAVRSITKTAANHCCEAVYSIRVNTVYPGYIRTPMNDAEAKNYGLNVEQHLARITKQYCPIGRIGEPIDIAYAVLYLASNESTFVTGADIFVDGGITAR